MEMMKKLAILVIAIILGGLGYVAYQRYIMQPSDNVQIQSKSNNGLSCASGKSCKSGHCVSGICQDSKTAKTLNKSTINPGQTSASCKTGKDCNSGHCYAGLCSQYDTKTNNKIVEGTALGVAAVPILATGAVAGGLASAALGGTAATVGVMAGGAAAGEAIEQSSIAIAK